MKRKFLTVLVCILFSYSCTIPNNYGFNKNFIDSVSKQIVPSSFFGPFKKNAENKALKEKQKLEKKEINEKNKAEVKRKKEEEKANKRALKEKEKLEKQQLKEEKRLEKNLQKRKDFLNKYYKIETSFSISADAGKNYGNMTKEFKVGEPVYMRMSIKLLPSKLRYYVYFKNWNYKYSLIKYINKDVIQDLSYNILCNLEIIGINISDTKFYDGVYIGDMNPIEEESIIKYPIKLPIEKITKEKEYVFVFQITPKSNSEIVSKLVFEEAMQIYNTQNTIRFTK